MRFMLFIPLVATLATAGAATGDRRADREAREAAEHQATIDAALKGLHPAGTQDCINLRDAQNTVRAGDTIIYQDAGRRRAYLNQTSGGCFGLDRGDAIITHTYTGQLCRGDIARTVDLVAHFESGSCSLGAFTVYKAS